MKLKEQIYAKKEIQQDKVKDKLRLLIQNFEGLGDLFKSGATRINLVMNDDSLSISEALRIKQKLSDIGMRIDTVVINKVRDIKIPERVKNEFNIRKIMVFPIAPENLLGYEALEEYVNMNPETFFCN